MTGFAIVDAKAEADDDIMPGISEKNRTHHRVMMEAQSVLKQKLRT